VSSRNTDSQLLCVLLGSAAAKLRHLRLQNKATHAAAGADCSCLSMQGQPPQSVPNILWRTEPYAPQLSRWRNFRTQHVVHSDLCWASCNGHMGCCCGLLGGAGQNEGSQVRA
jgi:hypothetical protein